MGWSGGSDMMSELIDTCDKLKLPGSTRFKLYKRMIQVFERDDWDTQDECIGEDPQYDKALRALHPEWFRDGRSLPDVGLR